MSLRAWLGDLSAIGTGEELQQVRQPSIRQQWVGKRAMVLHLVMVSPSSSLPGQITVPDQVGHDPVGGTLRDSHRGCDIPEPDAGVAGDAEQYQSVVREELPGWHFRT
jgi:hypothetical protein